MTLTQEIEQLAQSSQVDSERLQVLIHLVARLSKRFDGLDEDQELLRTENDNLRSEIGGIYGKALRSSEDSNAN